MDLTNAIEAAADALAQREWHFPNTVVSKDGKFHAELPAYDIARTVLEAAAPLIAEQVRQATADTIARAIDDECRKWADGSSWGNGMDRAAEIARAATARRAGDGDGTATP